MLSSSWAFTALHQCAPKQGVIALGRARPSGLSPPLVLPVPSLPQPLHLLRPGPRPSRTSRTSRCAPVASRCSSPCTSRCAQRRPPAVPLRPGPFPSRCVLRCTSRCAPAAAHLLLALHLLPASPVGPALPAAYAPPVSTAPPGRSVSVPVPRTAPVIALSAQQQQVRQLIKNDNIAVRCPLPTMPLPTMPLCPAPGAVRAGSRRSPGE